MKPFQDFLCWIGACTARPRTTAWASYARKQNSVNAFVLVSLLVILVVGFSDPIARFVLNFANYSPEFQTPRTEWRVLFSPPPPTVAVFKNENAAVVPTALWNSTARLSDSDHFSLVRKSENQTFWAGLKIRSSDAKAILDRQALQFVVGHVNAAFTLYVNGERRHEGDGRDYLPISINFSPSDLGRPDGVEVALELRQTLGSARPLVVDSPWVNGFYTAERARSLRDRWLVRQVIDPLCLSLAALLSSIAFLCLWISVRDRNEYFLFATYTLCHFAIQLNGWGSVRFAIHRTLAYQLEASLSLIEGCLAAMIGIAYARLRVSAYVAVILLGAIFGIVMVRSANAGSDYLYLTQFVSLHLVPFCFLLGGIACLSQAAIGKRFGFTGMPKQKVERRIVRLKIFAWLILTLGAIYFVNAHKIITIDAMAIWHRPLQYMVISLIGVFLFRDYREFDLLQQKVVTSRFHDPLVSEQRVVRGFLIALDLKKSSQLYDFSAQLALAKKIPTQWCELATEIVELSGGAKISSAGDSLIAFFEGENDEAFKSAVQSLLAIQGISKEFRQYSPEVHFRAGIIRASIRPIYKKVSRKMYEDYEDGPGETGFKNLMRFLETEKGLGTATKSVLVVDEALSKVIGEDLDLIKKQKLSVRDVGERELHYFDLVASAGRARRSEAA